jgi:hypothetical protein
MPLACTVRRLVERLLIRSDEQVLFADKSFSARPPKTAREPRALPYFFASFAQVSLNVTVRFQIRFCDVESGSSAK